VTSVDYRTRELYLVRKHNKANQACQFVPKLLHLKIDVLDTNIRPIQNRDLTMCKAECQLDDIQHY